LLQLRQIALLDLCTERRQTDHDHIHAKALCEIITVVLKPHPVEALHHRAAASLPDQASAGELPGSPHLGFLDRTWFCSVAD
jgi:hypothetical protein